MVDTFVAAIDQGTTSTRCLLFDHKGRMVSVAQLEHRHHYPQPGWVEHDAVEVWRNVTKVVPRAVRQAGIETAQVATLGIANQRETTVVWDPRNGKPVAHAINWQDTRTADFVDGLRQRARCGDVPRDQRPGALVVLRRARGCAGCSTTRPGCASRRRRGTRSSGRWRPG